MAHPSDFCPHGNLWVFALQSKCGCTHDEVNLNGAAQSMLIERLALENKEFCSRADKIDSFIDSLIDLLSWSRDSSCSDCVPIRSEASGGRGTNIHHFECGFLEARNKALALLNKPLEKGYTPLSKLEQAIELARGKSSELIDGTIAGLNRITAKVKKEWRKL